MENKTNTTFQLAEFVNMDVPEAILEEVKYNFIHSYFIKEFDLIRVVFKDFLDLFGGRYPGYKSCNTPYHDMSHSIDTLLVFSRIVDGYNIEKRVLSVKKVKIGLIAVLFHDSGFILKNDDTAKTGAKHSLVHEKKSIAFIRGYFKKAGLSREDFLLAENMIQCTDLRIIPSDITFKSETEKILGFMVGTADLVGQMAERNYLENLSHLYKEFKEGKIPGYTSEYDLLKKTINFYDDLAKKRLDDDFKGVYKYAQPHFRERYHIDGDLYIHAIERQLNYLKIILKECSHVSYKERLRRKGEEDE